MRAIENVFLAVCILALLALGMSRETFIIARDLSDGFTSQVYYVQACLDHGGISYLFGEELGAVHFARYLSVYHLVWLYENDYHHIFQYLFLVAALFPILVHRFRKGRPALQPLIVFLPLVISFRSVLVICAMSYLFLLLFTNKRSVTLLMLSAVWANLSSGSSVEWFVLGCLNFRLLQRQYGCAFALCMVGTLLSCLLSIQHKHVYFNDIRTIDTNWLHAMFFQNTILESYRNGEFTRLAVYCVMLVAGAGILFRSIVERDMPGRFTFFYSMVVLGFMVEGLSVLGFLVPVFWFYAGVRPENEVPVRVFGPAPPVRLRRGSHPVINAAVPGG